MNVASIIIAILLSVAVFYALKTLKRQGSCSCGSCDCSSCAGKQLAKEVKFDKCNCHK